jgi:electron transfer flavoprotein alpha subunit
MADIYVLIEHLRGQVADISYLMLAAGLDLAEKIGGRVTAVLLGYQAQDLGLDLAAHRVVYVNDPALADFVPEAYKKVLAALIQEHHPRLVLFGDTSIGAELAGGLSTRLDLPLVSYCREVAAEDGCLRFTSQICGGKLMAQGEIPEPVSLVTMIPGAYKPETGHSSQPKEVLLFTAPDLTDLRMALKQYIEPPAGDVDISKESILISIGRGIQNQDNIFLVEELAEALGGVLSASRPVVDQGWLASTRLVGKSGKSVKPTIYLALGISGAPEHVEAITGSEHIVAINTDPLAPIFNIAQYGAVVDLLELVPVLTDKVRQLRAVGTL